MWQRQCARTVIGLSLVLSLASVSTPAQEAEATQEQEPLHDIVKAEVTSYSSDPLETDDTPDITASGTKVHEGTAACPYQYPFGTHIQIAGMEYVCEDRMNRKYPDRFDIWSPSKEAATQWGIQEINIIIYK